MLPEIEFCEKPCFWKETFTSKVWPVKYLHFGYIGNSKWMLPDKGNDLFPIFTLYLSLISTPSDLIDSSRKICDPEPNYTEKVWSMGPITGPSLQK